MNYRKTKKSALNHWLSVPFIYMVFVPIVLLDIFTELYHQVAFRLYGMSRVERYKYVKIDRHKLSYLNWFDKINCAYCGYANGLAGYFSEIAARTEQYWCGIKHKKSSAFIEPKHHQEFIDYDDEKIFNQRYEK